MVFAGFCLKSYMKPAFESLKLRENFGWMYSSLPKPILQNFILSFDSFFWLWALAFCLDNNSVMFFFSCLACMNVSKWHKETAWEWLWTNRKFSVLVAEVLFLANLHGKILSFALPWGAWLCFDWSWFKVLFVEGLKWNLRVKWKLLLHFFGLPKASWFAAIWVQNSSTWLHGFCMKITLEIAFWPPKSLFVLLRPK